MITDMSLELVTSAPPEEPQSADADSDGDTLSDSEASRAIQDIDDKYAQLKGDWDGLNWELQTSLRKLEGLELYGHGIMVPWAYGIRTEPTTLTDVEDFFGVYTQARGEAGNLQELVQRKAMEGASITGKLEKKKAKLLERIEERKKKKHSRSSRSNTEVALYPCYRLRVTVEAETLPQGALAVKAKVGTGTPNRLDDGAAPKDTTGPSLRVSYMVMSARWVSRHELHLDTTARTGTLCFRAETTNTTGETWREAQVTLSTVQTKYSAFPERIPQLSQWKIGLRQNYSDDTGQYSLSELSALLTGGHPNLGGQPSLAGPSPGAVASKSPATGTNASTAIRGGLFGATPPVGGAPGAAGFGHSAPVTAGPASGGGSAAGGGLFGKSAASSGGSSGTAAPTVGPFGTAAPTASFFGTAAPTLNPFGTAAKTASPFGMAAKPASPFGTAAPTVSPFGTAAKTASPFGTAAKPASPFGTAAKPASPFGTAAPTVSPFGTEAKPASPFGTAAPTVSPFGTAAKPASPFGTAAKTASPSGTAAPTASPSGTAAPTVCPFGTAAPTIDPTAAPTTPHASGLLLGLAQPCSALLSGDRYANTPETVAPALAYQRGEKMSAATSVPETYGIASTFTLPGAKTMSSSLTALRLLVSETALDGVELSYTVVPKLRLAAYLTATFKLPSDAPVLPLHCNAGLNVDGVFLGYFLITRGDDGMISVPLGIDEMLDVSYETPSRRSGSKGIFQKEETLTCKRVWTVKNRRSQTVQVTVKDQIPTIDPELATKLKLTIRKPIGFSGAGEKNDIKIKESGEVEWDIRLKPGESRREELEWDVVMEKIDDLVSLS